MGLTGPMGIPDIDAFLVSDETAAAKWFIHPLPLTIPSKNIIVNIIRYITVERAL